MVILGAGGAARAIAVELALAGAAHLIVVNRRPRELPVEAEFHLWDGDYAVPPGTDVLVNATPIGLYPDVDARVPVDPTTFPEIVADVIPNPPQTRLLKDATAAVARPWTAWACSSPRARSASSSGPESSPTRG